MMELGEYVVQFLIELVGTLRDGNQLELVLKF
jgi:hypothetical protein